MGGHAAAPHAVEAPLSKVRLRRVRLRRVRLRRVRLRKRGLVADARHVRHIPWFILIVIPGCRRWCLIGGPSVFEQQANSA